MEKTYNGISWMGHITDTKNNQQSNTVTVDLCNEKAKAFGVEIIRLCEEFVRQNPEEWDRLEDYRNSESEY